MALERARKTRKDDEATHAMIDAKRVLVLEHKVAGVWSPMRRVTELEGERRIRRAQARVVEARVRPLRDDDRLDQLL